MKTENKYIKIPMLRGTAGGTYDIELSRIKHPRDVAAWVAHLGCKNWVTARMLKEFCEDVFRAKGWGYPSVCDFEAMNRRAEQTASCYPSSEGWWWLENEDGSRLPVRVEKRGSRQVLSACLPECSTHRETWWISLKSITGTWKGPVHGDPPAR